MVCHQESCALISHQLQASMALSQLGVLGEHGDQWHLLVVRVKYLCDAGGNGSDDDGGRGDGSDEGSEGFTLFTKEDIPTFAIALGISFLIRS